MQCTNLAPYNVGLDAHAVVNLKLLVGSGLSVENEV